MEKDNISIELSSGLNKNELRILGNLFLAEERKIKMYVSKLREIMKLAPVNLWKRLGSLEELGLIKTDDVGKGQKKYIHLTELGRNVGKFALILHDAEKKGNKVKIK